MEENRAPWQWPPRDVAKMSRNAMQRIRWVIDEGERTLTEVSVGLPKSDAVGHDKQLEFLLVDFASGIYCAFLKEASELLRQGQWTLDEFGTYAGMFIRDIAEGAMKKFRALATSSENKIEWKAHVFAHSEMVYAILNSRPVRVLSAELTASAKAQLFDPEESRNERSKPSGSGVQLGTAIAGTRHSDTAELTDREKKIWKVIQQGVKGPEYCREVHKAKLRPPKRWLNEGCPSTYPEAYHQGEPWSKRIQDEKHRIQKKAKLA